MKLRKLKLSGKHLAYLRCHLDKRKATKLARKAAKAGSGHGGFWLDDSGCCYGLGLHYRANYW